MSMTALSLFLSTLLAQALARWPYWPVCLEVHWGTAQTGHFSAGWCPGCSPSAAASPHGRRTFPLYHPAPRHTYTHFETRAFCYSKSIGKTREKRGKHTAPKCRGSGGDPYLSAKQGKQNSTQCKGNKCKGFIATTTTFHYNIMWWKRSPGIWALPADGQHRYCRTPRS